MIPVNDLRNGAYFQERGEPLQVLEYKHVKMGRGNATIKVKVKNLKSGSVLEKTFLSGNKVEDIEVARKKVQFLYSDQDTFYFMDPESFEQFEVSRSMLGHLANFLKDGQKVDLIKWEDQILGIEMPNTIELKVAETGPSEKGDSSGSVTKPATLETGAIVQVPMFIKVGDNLRIDSRNGSYIERAK